MGYKSLMQAKHRSLPLHEDFIVTTLLPLILMYFKFYETIVDKNTEVIFRTRNLSFSSFLSSLIYPLIAPPCHSKLGAHQDQEF